MTNLQSPKVNSTKRTLDDGFSSGTLVFSPDFHALYMNTITTAIPTNNNVNAFIGLTVVSLDASRKKCTENMILMLAAKLPRTIVKQQTGPF